MNSNNISYKNGFDKNIKFINIDDTDNNRKKIISNLSSKKSKL